GRFVRGLAGLVAGIDVCLAQPFRDGAFMDAEVLSDLGDRGLLVAVQSHADDVIAELFRVGLWHDVYPSRLAFKQARSDVTKSCISPSRIRRMPMSAATGRPAGCCSTPERPRIASLTSMSSSKTIASGHEPWTSACRGSIFAASWRRRRAAWSDSSHNTSSTTLTSLRIRHDRLQ